MNRLIEIQQKYQELYQETPAIIVRAPARINLIGEHTDYNDGFVMPAAIDRTIFFAMNTLPEAAWQLLAKDIHQEVHISLADQQKPTALWAQYFYAILLELQQKGYHSQGIRCVFGGNIPSGAGISSSAAMTCGFIYGLNELHQWGLSLLEIAQIGQAAEHQVGIQCGIMDQYAVLFGLTGQALRLDCRQLTHDYFPVETGDYQFVLFNSMVSHSLADSAYNDRRAACESVVNWIKQAHPTVNNVRDLSLPLLHSYKDQLPAKNFQRVAYVLEENQRVEQAGKALQNHDLSAFGQLLYQSHEGLSKEYEVSCEELDFLVHFVRQFPKQVLGARMMGGGFGGCTINLIHKDALDTIYDQLATAFNNRFGQRPDKHIINIQQGVSLVNFN